MPDALIPELDKRATVGTAPGLHAIFIGVSEYTNLPGPDDPEGEGFRALKKLQSSALSALHIMDKCVALDSEKRLFHPLASVRLLTAPSQVELDTEARLGKTGGVATMDAIRQALNDWRDDVASNRDNQALFFFSGHGMRRSPDESIILASDFLEKGKPSLTNTFNTANIRAGMAPGAGYEEIGRQQFYFVDACRDLPDALKTMAFANTSDIFDVDLNSFDDRNAPIFFPTVPGGQAYGEPGHLTFFADALLWALEHGAIDRRRLDGIGSVWPINADSLRLGIIAANAMFAGRLDVKGSVGNATLCFRETPPELNLRLSLAPDALCNLVNKVVVRELNTKLSHEILSGGKAGPFDQKILAGMYQAKVGRGPRKFRPSEVISLSIQSQMPWVFDLASAP